MWCTYISRKRCDSQGERCLDLEEEVNTMQGTIGVPADQLIKRTTSKKPMLKQLIDPVFQLSLLSGLLLRRSPQLQLNLAPQKKSAARGRGFGGLRNDKLVSPLPIPGKPNVPAEKDLSRYHTCHV